MSDDPFKIAKTLEKDYMSHDYSQLQLDASMIDPHNNDLWRAVDSHLRKDTDVLGQFGQLSLHEDPAALSRGLLRTQVGVEFGKSVEYAPDEAEYLNKRYDMNIKPGDKHTVIVDAYTPGQPKSKDVEFH